MRVDRDLRIELFGTLQVASEGAPIAISTHRLRSLLAFLVLHGGVAQSREHLAFRLWPESGESQARTNLRQLLHHLRRALPDSCTLLESDNHTVLWRRDPSCFVDVDAFDQAVERGDWEEAARLYQDDLLNGLYDEWIEPKREEYRKRLSQVLTRLATQWEERGDYARAIPHAERLVTHDPLSEPHHQMLIRLHAANGDRAGALRAYHQCMRILRRELAVEPDAVTRELFERILKSEAPAARVNAPVTAGDAIPLIGRQAEFESLLQCWRQTAEGAVRMALVSGEPGIGKSRLAAELAEWCSRHGASVARARCYAAQGRLAYAPVAEWLRTEPLRVARSRLSKPQLAELSRVLPEILGEEAGLSRPQPLTESWERHHFFDALIAALGGAPKPLLLVIDDLQWCDPDSLEWLHVLFRGEAAARTLIVGTLRPEETGRGHPFTRLWHEWKQTALALELRLSPLDASQTAELAAQVAHRTLAAGELAGIYRATEGNPLFVVESVRAGLGGAGAMSIPPRIHAVIGARLAQLSPAAYELAGLGAAVGQAFSFDLLAAATDWDERSLSQALEELWQRSLIAEQGALYNFTHDRIREVAYEELSPVRRRFLHRRIAGALLEMHAAAISSVSVQVAAHYEAAGMIEPAIRFYCDAAAVAQQRFAGVEAAGLLRRALRLCLRLPESPHRDVQELDLLVTLGPALVSTLGYAADEVGARYARALELLQHLGDTRHSLGVLSGSWVFHAVRSQLSAALHLAIRFLEAATSEGSAGLALAGHFPIGCTLFHLGRFEEVRTHMETTLSVEGGCSHPALNVFAGPDIVVFSRSYLSHTLWMLGYADQAQQQIENAVAAAEAMSQPFSQAIALDYAAILHVFRRESRAALARAEEAADLCRRHGLAYYLSMAEIVAGWAMAEEGDVVAGLARLRAGLQGLRDTGAEIRLPFYFSLLAETCARSGQMGEAMANLSTGFAFQSKNAEGWSAPELHRVQGDLLSAAGSREEAAASYRRAADAARQSGARILQLRAGVRLCRVAPSPSATEELHLLYKELTEGQGTRDLQDARSLLEGAARKAGGA